MSSFCERMVKDMSESPVCVQSEREPVLQQSEKAPVSIPKKAAVREKTIWIDIDNSPHVPFFIPIIEELEKRGHQILLTARDSYQVCELLEFHHLACKVVGSHWGKNRLLKTMGT